MADLLSLPSIVRACSCSAQYDAEGWAALSLVGRTRLAGKRLELRNCSRCGSTLTIERVAKARKPERVITNSAANCFRFCNRKYKRAYVDGLRPLRDADALRFGSLWHDGQESWWQKREWAPPIDADAFDLARARALLAGYSARWSLDGFEVLEIERAFSAPLIDGGGKRVRGWAIAGKVDGIVKQDGRLLLLEHKTTSEEVSPGSDYWARLTLDSQISIYHDGARALGYTVEGCLYDVCKKPGVRAGGQTPVLDDAGEKIVNDASGQRVKTLRGEWRQTADAAKGYVMQTRPETPEEYEARCIEAIADKPNEHFARAEIVRLDSELSTARDDLCATVRQIEWCGKRGAWPRNPSACFEYGRCPYFGLCTGTATEGEFRKVEDTHPELSS